jgi:hypothetical protein
MLHLIVEKLIQRCLRKENDMTGILDHGGDMALHMLGNALP